MGERERLVRDYLAAVTRCDKQGARACHTPDMRQTEYPNLLTPMTRVRTFKEMEMGLDSAREMLVEQSYDIVSIYNSGDTMIAEMVWRGRLKPGPLPPEMTAYFAVFFTFRDGLISSQRNYDCFGRPVA